MAGVAAGIRAQGEEQQWLHVTLYCRAQRLNYVLDASPFASLAKRKKIVPKLIKACPECGFSGTRTPDKEIKNNLSCVGGTETIFTWEDGEQPDRLSIRQQVKVALDELYGKLERLAAMESWRKVTMQLEDNDEKDEEEEDGEEPAGDEDEEVFVAEVVDEEDEDSTDVFVEAANVVKEDNRWETFREPPNRIWFLPKAWLSWLPRLGRPGDEQYWLFLQIECRSERLTFTLSAAPFADLAQREEIIPQLIEASNASGFKETRTPDKEVKNNFSTVGGRQLIYAWDEDEQPETDEIREKVKKALDEMHRKLERLATREPLRSYAASLK